MIPSFSNKIHKLINNTILKEMDKFIIVTIIFFAFIAIICTNAQGGGEEEGEDKQNAGKGLVREGNDAQNNENFLNPNEQSEGGASSGQPKKEIEDDFDDDFYQFNMPMEDLNQLLASIESDVKQQQEIPPPPMVHQSGPADQQFYSKQLNMPAAAVVKGQSQPTARPSFEISGKGPAAAIAGVKRKSVYTDNVPPWLRPNRRPNDKKILYMDRPGINQREQLYGRKIKDEQKNGEERKKLKSINNRLSTDLGDSLDSEKLGNQIDVKNIPQPEKLQQQSQTLQFLGNHPPQTHQIQAVQQQHQHYSQLPEFLRRQSVKQETRSPNPGTTGGSVASNPAPVVPFNVLESSPKVEMKQTRTAKRFTKLNPMPHLNTIPAPIPLQINQPKQQQQQLPLQQSHHQQQQLKLQKGKNIQAKQVLPLSSQHNTAMQFPGTNFSLHHEKKTAAAGSMSLLDQMQQQLQRQQQFPFPVQHKLPSASHSKILEQQKGGPPQNNLEQLDKKLSENMKNTMNIDNELLQIRDDLGKKGIPSEESEQLKKRQSDLRAFRKGFVDERKRLEEEKKNI